MIKKLTLTIVLATLCLGFWANAQGHVHAVTSAAKLPEDFWRQGHGIYQKDSTSNHTSICPFNRLYALKPKNPV